MTYSNSPWTPEKVDQLMALIAKGLKPAEIAPRLGVSRGAVIGKSHRIKLQAARMADLKARQP